MPWPKGRKNPGQSERMKGDNHPNKRPEVRAKFMGENNPQKRPDVREKNSKRMSGEKNPMFGKTDEKNPMWDKKHKPETIVLMKTKPRKHHIYLKENSDETIMLENGKHTQLHSKAYEYIYCTYGKKGVDNFLKWFDEKYG